MRTADAIVVGGGPGGSTCAWKLRAAGLDVLVLDKAAFPRTKLCAGWVTPEALRDLELEPGDYPHSLMTFDALRLNWKFLGIAPRTRQHSIRRYEFDDFLLRRAGAEVVEHKVRNVREDGGDYVIDESFRCRYLVGAGGTACPVYRNLFHDRNPRERRLQIATLEQEFAYDWQDPNCQLWFFDGGLPGYAWYVPKANGFINIGLGAIATITGRAVTATIFVATAGQSGPATPFSLATPPGWRRETWVRASDRLSPAGCARRGALPKGPSTRWRGSTNSACCWVARRWASKPAGGCFTRG